MSAKLGAINDCVNRHKDSVDGTPTGIVLAVKASSGRADARVEPGKIDASPLGACIRKVAEAIDFGPIPADRTIHQELQPK